VVSAASDQDFQILVKTFEFVQLLDVSLSTRDCFISYFQNDGSEEMYIGSADIMERNLDRRVEVLTPILEAQLRQILMEKVLQSQLKDNQLSFELLSDGTYERIRPEERDEEPYNSQIAMLQAYSEASN